MGVVNLRDADAAVEAMEVGHQLEKLAESAEVCERKPRAG